MNEERDFYNEVRDLINEWSDNEGIDEIKTQLKDIFDCIKEYKDN